MYFACEDGGGEGFKEFISSGFRFLDLKAVYFESIQLITIN